MNFQSDFQQLTSNPWLSFSKAWSKSFKVPNISTEPIFLHVFKWPKTKLVCCCERPCLPREDYDLWSNFNPLSWSFCEACVSIPIIYTVVHQTLPTYTTSLSSHQGKNLKNFSDWHMSNLFIHSTTAMYFAISCRARHQIFQKAAIHFLLYFLKQLRY